MSADLALSIENVSLSFGGLRAVGDFSLALKPGELAGVIGPNGAGKTTLFNILSGVYAPEQGGVRSFGRSLLGLKPHQVAGLGVVRSFQNIRLFKDLSVLDNVLASLHARADFGLLSTLFSRRSALEGEKRMRAQALGLLERLELAGRASERAASLPYGEQKKLEIARALATGCRVLLLDEPAAGMNSTESAWLMAAIRRLRDEFQLSILLIEHDMNVVMGLCERVHVMVHGVKIAEGTPEEVKRDPKVLEAYLGTRKGHG